MRNTGLTMRTGLTFHTTLLTLTIGLLLNPGLLLAGDGDDTDFPGKVWANLQSITMTQTWDESAGGDSYEGDATSSSLSVRAGYESEKWKGFRFFAEGQVVRALWEQEEDGLAKTATDSYKNLNNESESINQLFIGYGNDKHDIQVGRQYLSIEFLRDNKLRSKSHYYEGIVYRGSFSDDFEVLGGWIQRFSGLSKSWFRDIDQTFSLSGTVDRQGRSVSGSAEDYVGNTNGVLVGYVTYKGITDTKLQGYSYWFDDIVNITGGNVHYSPSIGPGKGLVKLRLVRQDSIGKLNETVNVSSSLIEASLGYTYNGFILNLGYAVISDPKPNQTNQIYAPYDSTFLIDTGMLGSGLLRSRAAGSDTLWLEARYNRKKFKSMLKIWLNEEVNGDNNMETDLILTFKFPKKYYCQPKIAYGRFDNMYGSNLDMGKWDLRFFVGRNF